MMTMNKSKLRIDHKPLDNFLQRNTKKKVVVYLGITTEGLFKFKKGNLKCICKESS